MSLETDLSEQFPETPTEEFPADKVGTRRNTKALAFLIAGTMADIATTALVLGSEYGTEENSLPSYLMKNFGVVNGQIILKSAMLGAYLLATYSVSPVLDKIFKTNKSAEKIIYFGGYTQFSISALNLLSYGGVNI